MAFTAGVLFGLILAAWIGAMASPDDPRLR